MSGAPPNDVQVQIHSVVDSYVSGTVTVGAADVFRAEGTFTPRIYGPGRSYPWQVTTPGTDSIPQRFATFQGAQREVEELTIRHYRLRCQEINRRITDASLAEMAKEITS